jgi:hypothetical protein
VTKAFLEVAEAGGAGAGASVNAFEGDLRGELGDEVQKKKTVAEKTSN